jgi:hypothetical protein
MNLWRWNTYLFFLTIKLGAIMGMARIMPDTPQRSSPRTRAKMVNSGFVFTCGTKIRGSNIQL